MLIFIAIAVAAFIIEGGAFLLGHDQDTGHAGDDLGHDSDAGTGGEPAVHFFSTKVVATLFMGFGAAGAIAMNYGAGHFVACLTGMFCGLVFAWLMYLLLKLFYSQQSSSLVPTRSAVGCTGAVTVSIGEHSPGEVGVFLEGEYRTFSATSSDGKPVAKGEKVLVLNNLGSSLVVEKDLLN